MERYFISFVVPNQKGLIKMQDFSFHMHTAGFDGRNSEEEMLQNESGWYLNLTEKKVLLLPNEVAKGGFIVDF